MGQYYYPVNLTKKQYLHPHKFGDGLKLLEFGDSGGGTMCGLALLLSSGNGRGGGDLSSKNPIIGSWAGDRIVIAGDYGDDGLFLEGIDAKTFEAFEKPGSVNLYAYASKMFKDISDDVLVAMCDDGYLKEGLRERLKNRMEDGYNPVPKKLRSALKPKPKESA